MIISEGACNQKMCGYDIGFENLKFIKQLEYNLGTQKLNFRKNINSTFKTLNIQTPSIFTEESTYEKLTQLFESFQNMESNPGKYYIYRIELIYYSNKYFLPQKNKTMDFILTTNPNKIHPEILERIIDSYREIAK